jgi:leucyl aminopeptidase
MEAVELTRNLVNRPANLTNTLQMTAEAKKLEKLGVKVQVFGPKELEKMGANLILSVAAGSAHPAQMIVMKWMGAGKNAPVRAAVGKGVMYDTGGYTIKPREGMSGMKADMAGAAAVLGLMKALATRKSKVNVIGVCGCAENMINENATRVGDVIKSLNGLTVEVNNTDAEGRLVLADCLAYLVKNEKPTEIIDIATLTGACMQALSAYYGGLFTPHDDLAATLSKVGEKTGERLWRLPIGPEFHKQNSSEVADLSNMPVGMGGASSAACFLENFVGKTRWAHLDIAGVGMSGKVPGVTTSLVGATGFGLRLLLNYFENTAKK